MMVIGEWNNGDLYAIICDKNKNRYYVSGSTYEEIYNILMSYGIFKLGEHTPIDDYIVEYVLNKKWSSYKNYYNYMKDLIKIGIDDSYYMSCISKNFKNVKFYIWSSSISDFIKE